MRLPFSNCAEIRLTFGLLCGNAGYRPQSTHARDEGPYERIRQTPIGCLVRYSKMHFAACCGNAKRTESPIPDRQSVTQIAIEVPWIAGVVNLMMGGTVDDVAQPAGRGDPNARMTQVQKSRKMQNEKRIHL